MTKVTPTHLKEIAEDLRITEHLHCYADVIDAAAEEITRLRRELRVFAKVVVQLSKKEKE